jgi:hypothetical protein
MVKYITKMESQITPELVHLLKLQLEEAKEAKNMIVYIRFFEVSVSLALTSDSLS